VERCRWWRLLFCRLAMLVPPRCSERFSGRTGEIQAISRPRRRRDRGVCHLHCPTQRGRLSAIQFEHSTLPGTTLLLDQSIKKTKPVCSESVMYILQYSWPAFLGQSARSKHSTTNDICRLSLAARDRRRAKPSLTRILCGCERSALQEGSSDMFVSAALRRASIAVFRARSSNPRASTCLKSALDKISNVQNATQ
jgi:hypothetical protein